MTSVGAPAPGTHPDSGRRGLLRRPGLVLALFAGRGAFRLTSQAAPLVLASVWGAERFGDYAAAVGLSSWFVLVVTSGEKAALKIVPRTPRISGQVVRTVLALALTPVLLAGLAIAAAAVGGAGDGLLLVLFAVLWSAGVGVQQVVAGLHRVRGRAGFDVAAYGAMTVAVAGSTLLAWWLEWSPLRLLMLLALSAVVIGLGSMVRLPAGWLLAGRRRRLIEGRVLRACLLLGLPDVLTAACVGVCYAVLKLNGERAGSGRFYVAVAIAGICSAVVIYLLRLLQPETSLRLSGTGGAVGRSRAAAVLRVALAVAAGAVAAGVLMWALDLPGWLQLAVLTAAEVLLFSLVTYASYLVENTDGRSPRITAGAALVGLVVAAGTAALLVPGHGPVGAMAALVIALAATASTIRIGLARRTAAVGRT